MKKFNAATLEQVGPGELMTPVGDSRKRSYPAYIGLDVHKDTIAWAIALEGRSESEYRGEIANRTKDIDKLIQRLNKQFKGEVLLWCYEAGPCGYGLHRQLLESRHDCQVVAPSKIPRQPGERIKLIGAMRSNWHACYAVVT